MTTFSSSCNFCKRQGGVFLILLISKVTYSPVWCWLGRSCRFVIYWTTITATSLVTKYRNTSLIGSVNILHNQKPSVSGMGAPPRPAPPREKRAAPPRPVPQKSKSCPALPRPAKIGKTCGAGRGKVYLNPLKIRPLSVPHCIALPLQMYCNNDVHIVQPPQW